MAAGGYYDIDTILSEEIRVPCVFTLDAVGMGVLDPTTSDEDLSQGAKVRLRDVDTTIDHSLHLEPSILKYATPFRTPGRRR